MTVLKYCDHIEQDILNITFVSIPVNKLSNMKCLLILYSKSLLLY